MEKHKILASYFDKQIIIIEKLYREIIQIDISLYSDRFVFALKTQQLYTALEDMFKQIAKAFENHIRDLSSFHKELLLRMNMEITTIRPAVLSKPSFLLLDKVFSFRHFIRHAYDCELDEDQLDFLQKKLQREFGQVEHDLNVFRKYIQEIAS